MVFVGPAPPFVIEGASYIFVNARAQRHAKRARHHSQPVGATGQRYYYYYYYLLAP